MFSTNLNVFYIESWLKINEWYVFVEDFYQFKEVLNLFMQIIYHLMIPVTGMKHIVVNNIYFYSPKRC